MTLDPEAIRDLFAGLCPVRTRRMFGGQGVYAGDVMFALEANGELYLKADDSVLPAFQAAGSGPFVYEKDGRIARMSYWRLPDEAARWGRLAIAAARRAAAARALKGVKPRRATRRKAAPHP